MHAQSRKLPPRHHGKSLARAAATLATTLLIVPTAVASATGAPSWMEATGFAQGATTAAPAEVRVGTTTYQKIDGFGFSDAFGQVGNLEAMPASVRGAVLDMLFSPTSGAGLDIVRFGLGASAANGGAGSLSDQEWLGRQAERFGVHTFYGDAWSAPAQFKTNGSQDNGGYLCGLPHETCSAGDFRQAYANYLAAESKDFAKAGLPLKAVDFVNEPENAPGYASMLMTPAQAANFVPYLGRALHKARLQTTVACCDAEGWANSTGFDGAQAYTQAVLSDPESARYIGLITGHGYTSAPTFPLTAKRPVWETEWSTFQKWDPAWNDGTSASGLSWADRIYTALTAANVNAFLYWWGTTTYTENGDNEGLIVLGTPSDPTAGTYQAAARLWAFGAFSRFVRPGAVRLATTSSDPNLEAVAFRKGQGTVVVLVNNGSSNVQVHVTLPNADFPGSTASAQPYLTDASDDGTTEPPVTVTNGSFTTTALAGAVVSYVMGVAPRPPAKRAALFGAPTD